MTPNPYNKPGYQTSNKCWQEGYYAGRKDEAEASAVVKGIMADLDVANAIVQQKTPPEPQPQVGEKWVFAYCGDFIEGRVTNITDGLAEIRYTKSDDFFSTLEWRKVDATWKPVQVKKLRQRAESPQSWWRGRFALTPWQIVKYGCVAWMAWKLDAGAHGKLLLQSLLAACGWH